MSETYLRHLIECRFLESVLREPTALDSIVMPLVDEFDDGSWLGTMTLRLRGTGIIVPYALVRSKRKSRKGNRINRPENDDRPARPAQRTLFEQEG